MIFKRVVTVVQAGALVLAVVAIFMLFTRQPPPATITSPVVDATGATGPAMAPDGKAIYLDQCAACHGDFGEGTYGPAFKGGVLTAKFPAVEDQLVIVGQGSAGTSMKGFADCLTPEQIRAVIDYTRGL